ncbi:MAG TPA: hypothetical protein VFY16_14015, partial [Gemmatimonadaceae bacterium]|nr:hypothetical protein [Gemmatimonadaceae bacterium]
MSSSEPTVIASARRAAPVLGASTALVGCSVLLGWAFGIDVLHAAFPRQASTIPNTAAGFVLCGVALVLATLGPRERRVALAVRALAGTVAFLAALTLAEHLMGSDLGIDRLLVDVLRASSPLSTTRMALNTCVAFILAGAALVLLDVRLGRGRRPTEALAGLTFLVAYLALVGRLYGVPQLFAVGPRASGMAPLTAITFLALSIGI